MNKSHSQTEQEDIAINLGDSLQYRNLTETSHAYSNLSTAEPWWSSCQGEQFWLCFCMYSFRPLAQNFYSKLRDHLLPHIQAALQQEAESHPGLSTPLNVPPLSLDKTTHDFVFFNYESIYQHKVIWFNFTSYDIWHRTNIVKLGGFHCNIMLLADCADGSSSSDFLYARVLGAYHANVIYTRPGMRDYTARCFNFLWVRWYHVVDPGSSGWRTSTLDTVRFPPMHEDNSFGFVDPNNVLRGCHILPAFAKGKREEANVNVSHCAKDTKDYLRYYVGR